MNAQLDRNTELEYIDSGGTSDGGGGLITASRVVDQREAQSEYSVLDKLDDLGSVWMRSLCLRNAHWTNGMIRLANPTTNDPITCSKR